MKSVLDMSVEEFAQELARINDKALYVQTYKATRATNGRYVNAARGKKLGGGFRYGSKAEVKRVRNVLYLNGGK
jgi:hypothetical protein